MKAQLLGALAISLVTAPQAYARTAHVIPAKAGTHVAPVAVDPADSLYRAAREALTGGDYENAARMFHDISARFPKSTLLPDAMYYEAFALYRVGNSESMRSAHELLASLQRRFPTYGNQSDAAALSTRICGELARQGDATCAASIAAQASSTAVGATSQRATSGSCPNADGDERIAALNALLQMDAARAEPILEKVLARRDECSAVLRRKAVFLVAQKESSKAADILLNVAKSDPDPDVREQAVFWMSQVKGDRATALLGDIVNGTGDIRLRKKALFALSQSQGTAGTTMLRSIASSNSQPVQLRQEAIFWLGQKDNGKANTQFLRDLYGKLSDNTLKDKVLFSLSQGEVADRGAWLLQVAQRSGEPTAMRKKALFYAGQAGVSINDLVAMYNKLPAGELREQMIFVFSQRSEPAAVDELVAIAKSDKDAKARKKALFWLGQSHDPRAMKALTEIIDR